jgi:hypothetical protein
MRQGAYGRPSLPPTRSADSIMDVMDFPVVAILLRCSQRLAKEGCEW